jgi:hypothetical protein
MHVFMIEWLLRVVIHTQGVPTESYGRSLKSRISASGLSKSGSLKNARLQIWSGSGCCDCNKDLNRSGKIHWGWVCITGQGATRPTRNVSALRRIAHCSKTDNSHSSMVHPIRLRNPKRLCERSYRWRMWSMQVPVFSVQFHKKPSLETWKHHAPPDGHVILSDLVSYNGMKSIKSKIKLFENCDSLLFGNSWYFRLTTKDGLEGGGKSHPQSVLELLRTSERALDTFCSFRTGSQPKILSDREGIADPHWITHHTTR